MFETTHNTSSYKHDVSDKKQACYQEIVQPAEFTWLEELGSFLNKVMFQRR